jgi:hypothetical protein
MSWSTTALNLEGRSRLYVAIKPQNSSRFRQIEIPVNRVGATPVPPAAPTNLKVIR